MITINRKDFYFKLVDTQNATLNVHLIMVQNDNMNFSKIEWAQQNSYPHLLSKLRYITDAN